MKFRVANESEAKQVYELVQDTIQTVYPKYYLSEIVDMFCEFHCYENVLKDIKEKNTYLLEENDEIIGTGTRHGNHITRVYVSPKFQKKGYGTYIMKQLEDIIKEEYTAADIDASLPACRLYAHLGYQTVDHGVWECKNGVIQVYEIMSKQLRDEKERMLRLRPYKPQDAYAIISWIKDEKELRKWSADRYSTYPVTAEDINYKYMECNGDCVEVDNFYPMTAMDENGPVGHLFLRYTNSERTVIRFGFVIIDDSKRGMGYGKEMIQMAVQYAFDMLKAEKITLGVFENNPSAYQCYKAVGFCETTDVVYEILGEKWRCIEMEMSNK